MKRFFVFFLLAVILAVGAAGCIQPRNDPADNPPSQTNGGSTGREKPGTADPGVVGESRESLGGVHLGMIVDEVDNLLGPNFTGKIETEGGYFGEGVIIRHYENGCDLVIGNTTKKVLQVDVFSSEYPTELGVRVGDPSMEALELYRERYPEFVGNQSGEKLAGWFEVESGELLIFSSMESRERSNENLTSESKIYGMTLGRSRFFD